MEPCPVSTASFSTASFSTASFEESESVLRSVDSAIQLIESIVSNNNDNHNDKDLRTSNNNNRTTDTAGNRGTSGATGTGGSNGSNTISLWSAGIHTPYHFSPSTLLCTPTDRNTSGGSTNGGGGGGGSTSGGGGGASSPAPPVRAWMVRAAGRARALLAGCVTPLCEMVSDDVTERVLGRVGEYCDGLQVVMDVYGDGDIDGDSHSGGGSGGGGGGNGGMEGGGGGGSVWVVEDGSARHVAAFVDEALVTIQRVRALADGSYSNLALAQGQGPGLAGGARGGGGGGRGSVLFGEAFGASSVPVRPFDYGDADTDAAAAAAAAVASSHSTHTHPHQPSTQSGVARDPGGAESVRPPFVALVQQGVAAVGAIQLHKITHALQAVEMSLKQQQQPQQQPQAQLPPSTSSAAAASALVREIIPPSHPASSQPKPWSSTT